MAVGRVTPGAEPEPGARLPVGWRCNTPAGHFMVQTTSISGAVRAVAKAPARRDGQALARRLRLVPGEGAMREWRRRPHEGCRIGGRRLHQAQNEKCLLILELRGYFSLLGQSRCNIEQLATMKLPEGRIALASPEFNNILTAVHSFHDGTLGCACFDYLGPMAFIDTMWFGPELGNNPKPIIGCLFWFDLNELKQVEERASYYDRGIHRISVSDATSSIEIQFLDEPFETLAFKFGREANFQFITSRSLGDTALERR